VKGTAGKPPRTPEKPSPPATTAHEQLPPDLVGVIRRYTSGLRAIRTREEYEKALRDFVKRAEIRGLADMLSVTSDRVVAYRNALQEAKLSAATAMLRLSAVSGFFGELVYQGRLMANPADPRALRRLLLSDVPRTEAPTLAEVRAMIESCPKNTTAGLRDRAILTTMLYQGLRRSEVSNLDHRDLDSRHGMLEIREAKRSPHEKIRIHPETEKAIGRYLKALKQDRKGVEFRSHESVFVSFSNVAGEDLRLCPAAVNNVVKDAARRVGIKRRVSAHSLRYACATLALEGGAPVHQVQRHLRHRDIRTTLRYDRAREARRNPTIDAIPPLNP
jgi:site-specific recombinase XerD